MGKPSTLLRVDRNGAWAIQVGRPLTWPLIVLSRESWSTDFRQERALDESSISYAAFG